MGNTEADQFECSNEESEVSDWPIFTIKSAKQKEITVNLEIQGHVQKMELETGASVSILSETDYYEHFHSEPLRPSSVILKTYTNETVPV